MVSVIISVTVLIHFKRYLSGSTSTSTKVTDESQNIEVT